MLSTFREWQLWGLSQNCDDQGKEVSETELIRCLRWAFPSPPPWPLLTIVRILLHKCVVACINIISEKWIMKYDGWGEKVRVEVTPCCHLTRFNPDFIILCVVNSFLLVCVLPEHQHASCLRPPSYLYVWYTCLVIVYLLGFLVWCSLASCARPERMITMVRWWAWTLSVLNSFLTPRKGEAVRIIKLVVCRYVDVA